LKPLETINDLKPTQWIEEGIISHLDLQFASLMERLSGGKDPCLFLAAALASRARDRGDVCLDLEREAGTILGGGEGVQPALQCPDHETWMKRLLASPVVGRPGEFKPLILDECSRLYLYRYWEYEAKLASWIRERAREPGGTFDPVSLKGVLDRLFPTENPGEIDWQKISAFVASRKKFCVISGGPGTGKTSTVSRIIGLLLELNGAKELRIALAAPTGKGASRLEEAIRKSKTLLDIPAPIRKSIPEEASTIHRLLGSRRDSPYFKHNAENPLPQDIVVVDEASMVDLALMSKLVQALSPEARLILLGDKDQLASVEAGAVLGDICNAGREHRFSIGFARELEKIAGCSVGGIHGGAPPEGGISDCIVELRKSYRFGSASGIQALSRAVKEGDAEGAVRLLEEGKFEDLIWKDISGYSNLPAAITPLVLEGFKDCFTKRDPEKVFNTFEKFRILCALREGPFGVKMINAAVERTLKRAGFIQQGSSEWYPGRPILVTRNDYALGLYNGDTGVVLPDPEKGNRLRVFFQESGGRLRAIHPSRLPQHETVYAMTVHKSQGSEFDHVLFLLPSHDSPILTKELIYTAITRARKRVDVWAPREIFSSAVSRQIARTSGLRDTLWGE